MNYFWKNITLNLIRKIKSKLNANKFKKNDLRKTQK